MLLTENYNKILDVMGQKVFSPKKQANIHPYSSIFQELKVTAVIQYFFCPKALRQSTPNKMMLTCSYFFLKLKTHTHTTAKPQVQYTTVKFSTSTSHIHNSFFLNFVPKKFHFQPISTHLKRQSFSH